ncbi:MAG: amidohydrolase family protein [bacterium]|nr:amidohydrolase family protein [bacterium]
MELFDVNVSIGYWPFQEFHLKDIKQLSRHLASYGISKGFVSSLESVFLSDPHNRNTILIQKLKGKRNFSPVPILNLRLKNFLEEFSFLVNCGVKAIKLVPSYHFYNILSENTFHILNACKKNQIIPIIQIRCEDERSHHPLMKVPPVNFKDIIKLSRIFHDLKILCLCPYFYEAIEICKKTENVYVDISFIERFNTIKALVEKVSAQKILFGSHTPFFYTKAAIMKIKFAEISQTDREKIMHINAMSLLKIEKC